MSEELPMQIEKWLNKSGYTLEMQACQKLANELSGTEWILSANEHHHDLETGAKREVDIELHWIDGLGSLPKSRVPVSIEIQVIFECRTTSQPWVVLRHNPDESRPWRNQKHPLIDVETLSGSIWWRQRQPSSNINSFVDSLATHLYTRLPTYPSPGYAIVDGLAKDGSKSESYDAVRQAVSSCINAAGTVYLSYTTAALSWYFPVVLTSAPLFEARLDSQTGSLIVDEVRRTSVEAPIRGATSCTVTVVRWPGIERLIDDLRGIPELVSRFLSRTRGKIKSEVPEESYILESSPDRIGVQRATQ